MAPGVAPQMGVADTKLDVGQQLAKMIKANPLYWDSCY